MYYIYFYKLYKSMNKKTIKITESELRSMIQKSLNENIDEAWYDDSVKNVAKKVGKGIAKGVAGTALAASIGAGGLYALDKGLENQEKYEQNINNQANLMNGPTSEEVNQWCKDHNMNPNDPNAVNQAYEWLQNEYEEKNSNDSNEIYENKKSFNETELVALIKENVIKAIKEGHKNGIF